MSCANLHLKKSAFLCVVLSSMIFPLRANEVTISSVQSVTGAVAFAGENYKNAIRLAIEEVNKIGGINGNKINLLERDSASNKGQAINLVHQAIGRDGAVMILGPSATPESVAIAPIVNDKKILNIGFANSEAVLKPGPWSQKFPQSPAVFSPLVADYVLNKTSVKKVAVIYDRTNEAYIEFKNYFRESFEAGGGRVIAEEAVVTDDSNFLPLATKLKSMDLDAVYISTFTEQSANILLQLRKAGISEKVLAIGTTTFVSPKFIAIAGKSAEGAIAISDYIPGVDRPINKKFELAYKARWGVEPDNWAANGYSMAQVSLAALKGAGVNPTREKVLQSYMALRDVPIVSGSGLWNHKDRKPYYGSVVVSVKNGNFQNAK